MLHLLIKARVASCHAHRKLAFSTPAHDTLGIIPLVAGVVTTLRMSTKNSVWELIDYTTFMGIELNVWNLGMHLFAHEHI